jgi:hypothetical protein
MLTHQTLYRIRDKSGNSHVLRTQLVNISSCMAFMRQVLGNKPCFQTCVNASGKQSRRLTPMWEQLYRLLPKYPNIWSPQYSFHPALTLFFEEYRKHPISGCSEYGPQDLLGNGRLVAGVFDDFVLTMRGQVSALGIKKKIADWESKTRKNRARMIEVEHQIFTSHQSVTVVRLNLEYLASSFDVEEIDQFILEADSENAKTLESYWSKADLSTMEPHTGRVTFEEVQTDRKHLFGNMKSKPSLFKHQIGYIWKIDATPKAGFRLCVALFFDATQCEEQEWLAHQIGDYWSHDITQARGRYVIPGHKNSDLFGLSAIDQIDRVARNNLREMVLSELCAVDQFVQVLPNPGANMFGSKFTAGAPQKRRPARSKGFEITRQTTVAPVVNDIQNRHRL